MEKEIDRMARNTVGEIFSMLLNADGVLTEKGKRIARKFIAELDENRDLTELRDFLRKRFPQGIQCFHTRNTVFDPMETIFLKDGITVDFCAVWGYIEIFGLTDTEFESIKREFDRR